MYEAYYQLSEEPFRLSSDHRFCYGHKSFARARAYMQYAFERAEGFVMITGQPGTGKTTLVNDLVHTLATTSSVKVAMLVTTQMEADDLLRMVAFSFGLKEDAPNKAALLQRLSDMLVSNHKNGGRALLIIDEAQGLSLNALEELRLLTNLQLNSVPLLQIFLLGQEGLQELIHRPEMEQVQQRLVATCFLKPLQEDETRAYVRHRLEVAGWHGRPLLSEAVFPIIYKYSQGIPRRINLICSRLFLYGSLDELDRIGVKQAEVVIAELRGEQLLPVGLETGNEFQVEDRFEEEVPSVAASPVDVKLDTPTEVQTPTPEPVVQEPTTVHGTTPEPAPLQGVTVAEGKDEPLIARPAPRPVKSGLKPRSSVQAPPEEPVRYQRNSDFGIVLFAVGSLLLIFIISLYFINPTAFVSKVQQAKSWFQQALGATVETPAWQLTDLRMLEPRSETVDAPLDQHI